MSPGGARRTFDLLTRTVVQITGGHMSQATFTQASDLPQANASALVDRAALERQVQDVYRGVARDPFAPRHFETGRKLLVHLGYPETLLAGIPDSALASFAG